MLKEVAGDDDGGQPSGRTCRRKGHWEEKSVYGLKMGKRVV